MWLCMGLTKKNSFALRKRFTWVISRTEYPRGLVTTDAKFTSYDHSGTYTQPRLSIPDQVYRKGWGFMARHGIYVPASPPIVEAQDWRHTSNQGCQLIFGLGCSFLYFPGCFFIGCELATLLHISTSNYLTIFLSIYYSAVFNTGK